VPEQPHDPAPSGRSTRRPALDPTVETALVAYLVRQAPTGFVVGTLTVAAVVLVLWSAAPHGILLAWVATIAVLTAPAIVVVRRFRRAADPGARIAAWRNALAVGYGLAGAGWGAASLLLSPRVAMPEQLFLLFVLGGSGVGGMAALSPVRPAFLAYLTATFFPMIGMLLVGDTSSSVATGLLLLAFWAATIALAAELRSLLVDSLELRFRNVELIGDLSRARDAAEEASRAKSRFLANVSHELRTPLALILGPTRRLLAAGRAGERGRADLETVERNAQSLLKHVGDLLDVAKLEAGRVELEPADVDLAALVRRTTSLFDGVARERAAAVRVAAPDALPMRADPAKIERVLLNLLSNAFKFVPQGGRVEVTVVRDRDDVTLTVEDDGPGVPPPLREVIFERFRQGDEGTARRFGGTGLGLAIAKELVERHDGRIEVEDGVDGGACFRVRLPFVPASAAAVVTGAPDDAVRAALDEIARGTLSELRPDAKRSATLQGTGSGGLVLILEDNADMSRFLVDCLATDYQVATAADGRHGLARARELRPDVIVADVMMPIMGGEAFVRELRADPELDGVPVIVLTAKADDALRVALLRDGAHDFLTKPVAAEELRARVANCVMVKRARDVLQRALSSHGRDVALLADQLAAANRAKEEFFAVLSHELRTPLTPILSWACLLREGDLDVNTTRRALETIERSAKSQMRIIEDLLDVSRAIAGKLRLNVRPTVLHAAVQAAVDSVRPAADAKVVRLDVALEPDASLVSGDADRLQQVVWNLVSNAVKFTPSGGRVEIRLGRVGEHVELVVRDDGCGIDPTLLPRLFERFWQADSSTTRPHGGLGLGLAVVQQLVDLHGGTVRAESGGHGCGATFTVSLPLLAPRAVAVAETRTSAADAGLPRCQGLRVLVVDDELDTCDIVQAVLRRAGAEVRTCLSASQALAAMDTWVPDILVSDIGMPGEDGYALMRKVRARASEAGGRVPAVALTAYGRSEDRLRALSAGFQMHVGKPIEPSTLVGIVASVALTGDATVPRS
jgi:signal transduction histidine kinase